MPENSSTTTVHSVELSLKAVLEDFVRGMRSAEQQSRTTAQRMGQDFRGVERDAIGTQQAVHGLKSAFMQLAGAIGAAYSLHQIGEFFRGITQLAGRVEVLEVVSRNMGKTAGYTREEVLRYVQAVKDLNITTQEANLSTTKFMQAGLPLDKLTKIVRVAQDTGVIMGKSTQESLAGIVHGIITLQPEVLRTYGIFTNLDMAYRKFARTANITYDEISQQQKQQIALNEVLEKGAVFVGTYETAMTKAHKQMLSLERVTEEFKVSMGREFQMLFSSLITKATELLTVGKNSAELHQMFRGLADGAFHAMKAVLVLGKALWELREVIKLTISAWILYKGISFLPLLFASIASEVSLVTLAVTSLQGALLPLALTMAGFYALKDMPPIISVLVLALGVLTLALSRTAIAASAAWGSLLTPIGAGLAVAATVALLTQSFNSLSLEQEKSEYQQKQLQASAMSTASEFVVLRQTALDLASGIVELGKKSNLTKDEVDEVNSSFARLRKLAPDVAKDVTDLKDIFAESAKAVETLDKQLVTLTLNRLKVQIDEARNATKALNFEQSNLLLKGAGGDALGARLQKWNKEALAFIFSAKQGVVDIAEWNRLNEEFQRNTIALGEELNTVGAKSERGAQLGIWSDAMSTAYTEAARFGDKISTIVDLQAQHEKLLKAQSTLIKGDNSELVTKEQRENRLQAQHQMRMQLFELQKKAGKDINFLKEKELEADKDIAQAMEILRKAENLGETGKEYQELIELLKTYKTLMSEQAQVELQLHDIRLKEKLMKVGVQTDDVQSLKDLRTEYGLLIAQLSSLPMTDAVVELLDTYRAKFRALGIEIPELIQRISDAKDREDQRLQREKEREDRRLARGWLSDLGGQALAFRTFMGAYKGFINTLVDFEMTGKEKRVAIWHDMLNEFSNIVDLMIRKWLIMQALTGIFGLPAGVAGELLGFGTGSGGGIFSAGGDNRQVVRELQQINSTLGDKRGGATQTLSITADRLDATVTNGSRQRGRNRLNGNR